MSVQHQTPPFAKHALHGTTKQPPQRATPEPPSKRVDAPTPDQRVGVSCFGCFPKRTEMSRDAEKVVPREGFCAPVLPSSRMASLKSRPRTIDGGKNAERSCDHLWEWECWSTKEAETVYYKPPDLKTDEQYFILHSEFQQRLAKSTTKSRVFDSCDKGKKTTSASRTDFRCKSAGEGDEFYLDSFSSGSFSGVPTVMFPRSFWKLLDKFRLSTTASSSVESKSTQVGSSADSRSDPPSIHSSNVC